MDKSVKYLILGAGISGLTFANFIKDEDYLIIEKESEIGGLCRTIKENGFIWDYAGHFFHFNNQKIKDLFNEMMNENEVIIQEKNTKIHYNEKFIDFPFQKNIHQLDKEEFIECLYDLYFKKEQKKYNNFKEMLFGKFGQGITKKFLQPYNEKLYACELCELDENAMGRFFPYASLEDIIKNMKEQNNKSYNDKFMYPKGGAEVFIKEIAKKIKFENISLSTNVTHIDTKNKQVETSNGNIKYQYLISTMPFNFFLENSDIEEKEKLTNCFTANKVLVFNLGFDKKSKYDDIHWIYAPDKEINFYRVGFYDNIMKTDRLSLYVEIGFKENDKIDIESNLKDTLNNLRKMGIIENHKLLNYCSMTIDPAYVHITEASQTAYHKISNYLEEQDIYCVGRYGKWTYCSIEDSMIDAMNLSNKFNSEVEHESTCML